MNTTQGLGYPKNQISSSNYADGSSYNYSHPNPSSSQGYGGGGTLTGTVHELNQSNPNLTPQNFSSTKFSPENSFQGNSSSSTSHGSYGLMTSNKGSISAVADPPTNATATPRTIPSQKPKEPSPFPVGTKSNNQPDTDSKWTNAYVFNTGTTPGSLSTSVMDSLKPKWGPSRDELKDKLANSLASDMNVSILPGFCQSGDGRRSLWNRASEPYLNYGGRGDEMTETERVPTPVTRARNAITASRSQIGQTQSLLEMNKTKAQGIYRNPRGNAWNTIGTPGFGGDLYSVKRYKQDSYRKDLEQQIHQKKLRMAEERKQRLEGIHPLGVKYNSFTPNYYETPKLSLPNSTFLDNEYAKLGLKPSPRYQPKSVTDDIIGKSAIVENQPLSQRRHFPQYQGIDPIAHEIPSPGAQGPPPQQQKGPPSQQQQRSPQYQQKYQKQSQPQHPNYFPNRSHTAANGPPPGYPPQPWPYYPYPPPQVYYPQPSSTTYQEYQLYPQYPPLPGTTHQPPTPHQQVQGQSNVSSPQQQNGRIKPRNDPAQMQQQRDVIGRSVASLARGPETSEGITAKTVENQENKVNDDEGIMNEDDDCMIPLRMRIWQTSDQLPDPEIKKCAYKIELKKQIIQKRNERNAQLAKEAEEDERHEQRIREYQERMKLELEREREQLARRCRDKETERDLALLRAAETYRLNKEKHESKCKKESDKIIEDKNACDDIRENSSSTSVSSADSHATFLISKPSVISGIPQQAPPTTSFPAIVLPTFSNSTGASSDQQQKSPRHMITMSNLAHIQKILSLEARRVEQRLSSADDL